MAPIDIACVHGATDAEKQRDPDCTGCFAQPGQPCRWARRWDGESDPPFHSERIEASVTEGGSTEHVTKAEFDNAVEADGSIF